MLELPQKTLDKIKKVLQRRKKYVEEELKVAEEEDPVLALGVAESTEPGTDSFRADVHARLQVVKANLLDLYKKIQQSLLSLKKGTYGKCERCGKPIELERLEAMPTATLCLICSQKGSKK